MRRVVIILTVLCFAAALIICGKAFAQTDANDSQKPIKALEATEATEPAEPTEATIPYSAPYNSPDTGADEVEVDEDS